MKRRKIHITENDKNRLETLINEAQAFGEYGKVDLSLLREELGRAIIVTADKVPPNVVTMNSKVLLRNEQSSEEVTYTLVFPDDADITARAISVLAPIGMAILGYAEGDVVEWQVPSGKRQFLVEKILYQPEAEGDYDL